MTTRTWQDETITDLIESARRICADTESCTCPDEPHHNRLHELAQDLLRLSEVKNPHERVSAGRCSCGAEYTLRWMTWDDWWADHQQVSQPAERPCSAGCGRTARGASSLCQSCHSYACDGGDDIG